MSKLSKVKKKVKALNNYRSDKSFAQFPKYIQTSIGYNCNEFESQPIKESIPVKTEDRKKFYLNKLPDN